MEISLLTPSWGNSQPWTLYIASGATLENIRKEWIAKNKEGNKGNTDIPVGHRSDFSERCQKCTNDVVKYFGEVLNDPSSKAVWDANIILFNAPTVVYLQYPNKGLYIIYLILVLLKCLSWQLLKNEELILCLLMKL